MNYYNDRIESVYHWINRQLWTENMKQAAAIVVQTRGERSLNPMTEDDWRRWARNFA